MQQQKITDDLQALMAVLPPEIAKAVTAANDSDNLLEVILDLGKPTRIRHIIMRFLSVPGSWIFLPEGIEVSSSNTPERFTLVANARYGKPKETSMMQKHTISLRNVQARYLKIKVRNTGKCPEWHSVPGGDAWVFTDEIFLE